MSGIPPGWYPDPFGRAELRWWDGGQWTPGQQGRSRQDQQIRTFANLGVAAGAVIGTILACFTSVSLLTGTTTVWVGVALALIAAIAALSLRWVSLWLKIVASLLALACIASGIYDEVQLQHKRDQLSHLLDG